MASKVLLQPSEEDAVIKERFLTGASVGRGEPPFKKLIKRYHADAKRRFRSLNDRTDTRSCLHDIAGNLS